MTAGPSEPATASCLARFAAAVAGLGDEGWIASLVAIGAPAPDGAAPGIPTYEALATAGTATVAALVDAGRWEQAADQADRLTAVFRLNRHHLHPVAAESFDGLRAAVHSRDPDEVRDFVELLGELFGDERG